MGGKRKKKFFRINIGLDSETGEPEYEKLTPLFLEMKIALEYLHISHEEYLKLSSYERQKAVLYEEMKRGRKAFFDKEEVKAYKNAQNNNKQKNYNMQPG